MSEKFTGIVIDIRRHNDRNNIVTLFTRERGRVAFLSSAGSGKGAKLRQARLQPLSVIEGEMVFRPTADLQRLGGFSMAYVWDDMYFNPVKSVIVLFVTEFLNKLLRATMPDPSLWDYICNSLRLFNAQKDRVADFHIVFLASLLPFLGIQPDVRQYTPGCFFDMQAGAFTACRPLHRDWLGGEEAEMAAKICRLNFSNMKGMRLGGALRSIIIGKLLHYYSIHFPGTSSLRSLPVLQDLFH